MNLLNYHNYYLDLLAIDIFTLLIYIIVNKVVSLTN